MRIKKMFSRRLRVTKTGKVLARQPGKNHFKARKSRRHQLDHKRPNEFVAVRKTLNRFI